VSERSERLEEQLTQLSAQPVSPALMQRIGQQLKQRENPTWGDRMLMAAIGCGALAACVIIGTVGQAMMESSTQSVDAGPAGKVTIVAAPAPPRAGDYLLAYAHLADGHDVDAWR
jgi:hypothetical protein